MEGINKSVAALTTLMVTGPFDGGVSIIILS